ncbi:hypothetical protein BX070DRAFT_248713 [Coemansia spiralis]|nr:hypothetical protein BX070DRAFT_248713 [Coemansia spiralis]
MPVTANENAINEKAGSDIRFIYGDKAQEKHQTMRNHYTDDTRQIWKRNVSLYILQQLALSLVAYKAMQQRSSKQRKKKGGRKANNERKINENAANKFEINPTDTYTTRQLLNIFKIKAGGRERMALNQSIFSFNSWHPAAVAWILSKRNIDTRFACHADFGSLQGKHVPIVHIDLNYIVRFNQFIEVVIVADSVYAEGIGVKAKLIGGDKGNLFLSKNLTDGPFEISKRSIHRHRDKIAETTMVVVIRHKHHLIGGDECQKRYSGTQKNKKVLWAYGLINP